MRATDADTAMVWLPNAGHFEGSWPRAAVFPACSVANDRRSAARAPARRRPPMADFDPLIRRAQTGEPRAVRELFERHRGDVARIAFRVIGPSPDLEDVVQESFVQMFRSLASYRGDSKFSTWLYRVVTNVARMHVRHERSRPALTSEHMPVIDRMPSADGARPDAAAERNERVRALYAQLDALSDKKRIVLALHDLAGVSATEIADIVGAPVLTVRTRLFYARKDLYAALANDPTLGEMFGALRGTGTEGDGGGESG
jgi:RNA polymerase sigma-70 factor (ECF subfamily)